MVKDYIFQMEDGLHYLSIRPLNIRESVFVTDSHRKSWSVKLLNEPVF